MTLETLKEILFCTALSAVLGVSCQPAHAAQCADDDMECHIQKGKQRWIEENGDIPRPLTPTEQAEVWEYLKKHYPNQDFNNPSEGEL